MCVIVNWRAWGRSNMGSVSQSSIAAARGNTKDKPEISRAAKLLVDQHGSDADIVAAHRADALFCEGKTTEGTRWLEIFRRLAMMSLSGAAKKPY
jgi:hypothetical protein